MAAYNSFEIEPAAEPVKPKWRWLEAAGLAVGRVVTLALLALGALWWWAGTEGSLATAIQWVGPSLPLTAERVTGSLRSAGHIDRLRWQQDGLKVDARDVNLAWQPWSLLHGTLKLDRLTAASLEVDDQRTTKAVPANPPTSLRLPLPVAVGTFSLGQLLLTGPTAFAASDISGRYQFNGLEHQLDLLSAQVASGHYSGRAVLSSGSPLMLHANLSATLTAALTTSKTPLPLALKATANGPLTELLVSADLQMNAKPAAGRAPPQASATARVQPWATQPLPQADAHFRDLDIAALWPGAPQTQLTGSAEVRPLGRTEASTSPAWALQLQVVNQLAGPWDRQRLPLEHLEAQGEWREGVSMIHALKARLGGGELLASGEWTGAPPVTPPTPATGKTSQAWKLQATLQHVNPALLLTQLAPLPLDGRATMDGRDGATRFKANLQATGSATKRPPDSKTTPTQSHPGGPLRLRNASATGSWSPQASGGTLVLSALRIRTDDTEVSGQLEVQPTARGGKGNLTLTAPGLDAKLQGELRRTSGRGELNLRGQDATQALRWLQKIPGMPAAIQSAVASGSAELQASWQGGWLDPDLQARLDLPSLDWQTAGLTATKGANTPATAAAGVLKIRALKATLSGRLSKAQLSTQGRLEVAQRRYTLLLAAEGGHIQRATGASTALGESTWQGLLRQFSLTVEDPALGTGAWRLTTRTPVPLKWMPTRAGGSFESGGGEALLSAPPSASTNVPLSTAPSNPPSQATLTWQPLRWRPGELITSGTFTGLPMAWIELVGGPQMAGAGLAGNLIFEGAWDARFGDSLALKASLTRSSGDITLQTNTVQGTSTRVVAGVRQASVSLVNQGDALTLALRWDSERAGTADARLSTRLMRAPTGAGVGGWIWPADAPLNGQLRAQLPRIGVWSVLAPPGWRLRGSLGADVTISGTRGSPQLSGDLQANDMALRSVVDGIEFGNGRLRARLDGQRMQINEFSLQGAGERGTGGLLTAQGEAGWIGGRPQVKLNAKLDRLRASLRTDRKITLSGEMQASLNGDQTSLIGQLVVDQARIILPDEGTPKLGDDVVVRTKSGAGVGQKAPAEASASAPSNENRAVNLAVQLDLGPDFRIQGKGLDTRVRGILALNGESLRNPRLTGTITTAGGQYRAYGQRLDVEQGVLRFTGPLDNPALDILAIRPNLTQRVGVQITGTALLPRVRLYAEPELPDAEKLSWLVVGRPAAAGGAEAALLQQAALALLGSKSGGLSGGLAASLGLDELSFRGASSNSSGSTTEGAVTLGKRFSRNFYAAYERSISGALGTLYIFYDLSQRFTVRAQAGQQSAVDLIFTVPYD